MTWTATCPQLAQVQSSQAWETSDSVSVWLAGHFAHHLVFLYIPRSPLLLTPHVPLTRFLVPRLTLSRAPYVIPHPLLCSIPCLSRDSVPLILRDPLPFAVTDISGRAGLSLPHSRFLECHATWGTLRDIPKTAARDTLLCLPEPQLSIRCSIFKMPHFHVWFVALWNNLKTKRKL